MCSLEAYSFIKITYLFRLGIHFVSATKIKNQNIQNQDKNINTPPLLKEIQEFIHLNLFCTP